MNNKTALFHLIAAFSCATSFAQGSLNYHVAIDGAQMVPPNPVPRTASGDFILETGLLFSGTVWVPFYTGGKSASLFRSDSASELGFPIFDFTKGLSVEPFPPFSQGEQGFDIARTLTQSEATDLQAGRWYVVVDTVENGQYRGRIELVPEPATWALIISAVALLALKGAREKPRPPQP